MVSSGLNLKTFAAIGAAALSLAAAPATANESDGAIGGGDAQFGKLFESWQRADGEVAKTAAAAGPRVLVPTGMPVQNVALTSDYGMRNHPVLRRRAQHKGVDLAGPTGTPIYATADGRVSMAQRYSSYGLYVQIEHDSDVQTRYAHMSQIAATEGSYVRKGDLIGYIGSTGRSTGPHLHYEIRIAGQAVNPIPYMTQPEPAYQMARAEGGAAGGPE